MAENDLSDRIKAARTILKEATADLAGAWQSPQAVTAKDAPSPVVTELDLQTEQALRDRLAQAFPGDSIAGEELEPRQGTSGWDWIIDPIDGTLAFIAGLATFTTLLALEKKDAPRYGFIYQPVTDTLYEGDGKAAWKNGKRINVGGRSFGILASGAPLLLSSAARKALLALQSEGLAIMAGGDALLFGALAEGRIEAVVDEQLAWHDIAPAIPVLEGAGARVTDFRGKPLKKGEGPYSILASASDSSIPDRFRALLHNQ